MLEVEATKPLPFLKGNAKQGKYQVPSQQRRKVKLKEEGQIGNQGNTCQSPVAVVPAQPVSTTPNESIHYPFKPKQTPNTRINA